MADDELIRGGMYCLVELPCIVLEWAVRGGLLINVNQSRSLSITKARACHASDTKTKERSRATGSASATHDNVTTVTTFKE